MPRFVDNLDAVVNTIGTSNVGLVWGLANMRWQSEEDRDSFLAEITQQRG